MKKIILFIVVAILIILPISTNAQTDEQIRSSLVQKSIDLLVVQVNILDEMLTIINTASNKASFSSFISLINSQIQNSVSQLTTLLDPTIGLQNNPHPTLNDPASTTTPEQTQTIGDVFKNLTPVLVQTQSKVIDGKNTKRVIFSIPRSELSFNFGKTKNTIRAWCSKSIRGIEDKSHISSRLIKASDQVPHDRIFADITVKEGDYNLNTCEFRYYEDNIFEYISTKSLTI